jgi:hypothetical protein
MRQISIRCIRNLSTMDSFLRPYRGSFSPVFRVDAPIPERPRRVRGAKDGSPTSMSNRSEARQADRIALLWENVVRCHNASHGTESQSRIRVSCGYDQADQVALATVPASNSHNKNLQLPKGRSLDDRNLFERAPQKGRQLAQS